MPAPLIPPPLPDQSPLIAVPADAGHSARPDPAAAHRLPPHHFIGVDFKARRPDQDRQHV